MTRSRSIMAGMTDYTGVPLTDILEHFADWRAGLDYSVMGLGNIRARLATHTEDRRAADGLGFLDHFVDLFRRFADDCGRLATEMPTGVRTRHVAVVSQMYES